MAGLEAAIRAGDVARVADALEREDPDAFQADLGWAGDLGKGGALHLASFLGFLPIMHVLLGRAEREDEGRGGGGGALRAALERGTDSGATALLCAVTAAQEAAATLLLDRGADVEAANDDGWTPVMFAARNGHAGTAALLLDRGHFGRGTRPEPFNFTSMGVNPISSGSPHVRQMVRTCGEPDEIKKNTYPIKCYRSFPCPGRRRLDRNHDCGKQRPHGHGHAAA